jgi:hypothetical protein
VGDYDRLETRRVQNDLIAKEYVALMNDNIEDLTELRLWSLEKIKENKAKVAHVQQESQAKRIPSRRSGLGSGVTIGD